MEDVHVPEPTPASAESSVKLTGGAWLENFRKEQALRIAQLRAEQKAKARPVRRQKSADVRAERVSEPKSELSPEEIERRRQRKNAKQGRYRVRLRKAKLQTPEAKAKRKAANQKRWRRNKKKRERRERWLKKLAVAAQKRADKELRRVRREAIAEEKRRVAEAQGLMIPKTKRTRDLEAEYARGFKDGFAECLRIGRAGDDPPGSAQAVNTI